MNKIKLVITDVDDTLVIRHTYNVSERNATMIRKLESRGVHVAIASARPAGMAQPILDKLGLKGLQVIDGGATIYDFTNNEEVWRCWIDLSRLRQVAQAAMKFATVIDSFPTMNMLSVEDFSLDQVNEDAPYVYCKMNTKDVPMLFQQLSKIDNVVPFIVADDGDGICHVQIQDIGGTKKHAVERLQAIMGITAKETLAIGDKSNDHALFETAEMRVAMGNATEDLKRQATFVTDSVEQDGWAIAMEKLGIVDAEESADQRITHCGSWNCCFLRVNGAHSGDGRAFDLPKYES